LLGQNPADDLKKLMSSEKQVTAATRLAFIVHSTADRTVPVAIRTSMSRHWKKIMSRWFTSKGVWGAWLRPHRRVDAQCLAWLRTKKF